MSGPEDHPLAATAARAGEARDWCTVAFATDPPAGSTRCSDVDADFIRAWEAAAAADQEDHYGRTHPMAATGYVLGWYADIAASAGALCFLTDRRVPQLTASAIAFKRFEGRSYPDSVALLDPRFWCLPTDPAANHPDATVVPDEEALAAILRAEVRRHADEFLRHYSPGSRLPRRNLLGAFFDGLDSGFWLFESPLPITEKEFVACARVALPGAAAEFPEPSSYCTVTDIRGREHLTRRRVSCCYYYKLSDNAEACTTCPRTTDEERLRLLSEHADEEANQSDSH